MFPLEGHNTQRADLVNVRTRVEPRRDLVLHAPRDVASLLCNHNCVAIFWLETWLPLCARSGESLCPKNLEGSPSF